MPHPWEAEIEVAPGLAIRLVNEQFPSLRARRASLLGRGWDNTALLLNDDLVFRFPRKQSTVALVETEARVLPALAPRLPLRIPAPEWLGRPSEAYPWPFLGHRRVPGTSACQARLSEAQRRSAAPVLAEFLLRLHGVPIADLDLPGDVLERGDFVRRRPLIVERLEVLRDRGLVAEPGPWLRLFESADAEPRRYFPVLAHGDLHACHLLVDGAGGVSGIIDWGDVHAGDAAIDLLVLYAFLPAAARAEFLDVYGPVDAATLAVARLRAALVAITIAWHGSEIGDAELVGEGLTAMRLVLTD